jgi:excisionase family DNA binding protein
MAAPSRARRSAGRKMALSIEEAAATLSLSRDTFERHVVPQLRVVRVGRRLLVPVRVLEQWLEQEAAEPLLAELARLQNGGEVGRSSHE